MQVTFGPQVARRVLRYELERLCELAGKTHAQAGERLGISRVGFTHLLSGKNLPSKPALEILLDFFGHPERKPYMLELLAAARLRQGTVRQDDGSSSMSDFELFVGLEAMARDIEAFEPAVVTGLLQTESYARTLITYHASITVGVNIDESVALRLRRQTVVTREASPARLWCVIEEQALRRPVGDPDVMVGQLDHLLEMTRRPNINLQVIPGEVGLHPALKGAFFLLRFEDDWGLAYEETRLAAHYHDRPEAVEDYEQVMGHLRRLALDPKRSRDFIAAMRKDLR